MIMYKHAGITDEEVEEKMKTLLDIALQNKLASLIEI